MKSIPFTASARLLILAVILSFPAGILNGVFGTGSGIIFMLISRLVSCSTNGNSSVSDEQAAKDMYTFSMTCVIIVSMFSLLFYSRASGAISDIVTLAIPAVSGGILGGLIKEKIRASWLNMAFAMITIYSGISMIVKSGVFR